MSHGLIQFYLKYDNNKLTFIIFSYCNLSAAMMTSNTCQRVEVTLSINLKTLTQDLISQLSTWEEGGNEDTTKQVSKTLKVLPQLGRNF